MNISIVWTEVLFTNPNVPSSQWTLIEFHPEYRLRIEGIRQILSRYGIDPKECDIPSPKNRTAIKREVINFVRSGRGHGVYILTLIHGLQGFLVVPLVGVMPSQPTFEVCTFQQINAALNHYAQSSPHSKKHFLFLVPKSALRKIGFSRKVKKIDVQIDCPKDHPKPVTARRVKRELPMLRPSPGRRQGLEAFIDDDYDPIEVG